MCLLEHDIEVVKILESHIENDREYEFWLHIGLSFRHVWTGPFCQINNNSLLFYFLSQ